jgi:microcin C transport system substrate-binding protein
MKKVYLILFLCFLSFNVHSTQPAPTPSLPTHGFSAFGTLKYPADFTHFDYVNPDAPKGGTIRLGSIATFDSLNLYIIKGIPPGLILITAATLLDEARDCAGESYAYAAESVEVAPDNSSVTFRLNPNAKFNNGDPVTADDVIWVFETLKEKGQPMYRTYYKNISKVEKLDDRTIKFSFNTTTNRELPGILGQLPILSKKFYETHPFEETTLKVAPSSGPYEVETVAAGHSFVIKRVKDWWGTNLPSQKGRYNFERFRADYYREANALFEGFKSGQIDVRSESIAKNWATAYTFPAFQKGYVKKEELKHSLSSGTVGLVFNTRKPIFADWRVRKALTLLLDFPWINKHLFYGLYERNLSYYPNSDFAAQGEPSEDEKAILAPYKDKIPPEALTQAFTLPTPQNESDLRELQEQVQNLLKEAGYEIKDAVMVNTKTGKPLTIEFLSFDKAHEKILLNYVASLNRVGIKGTIRSLDPAAFELRTTRLDFDMVYNGIVQSPSLGNEQRDYFGSERADTPGTRNLSGIKNPVVDSLIEKLINARDYKQLTDTAKALDRVLLWNYYMIPSWHSNVERIAYWDRFSRPSINPKYHPLDLSTWWFDQKKDANITQQHNEKQPEDKKNPSFWARIRGWFS